MIMGSLLVMMRANSLLSALISQREMALIVILHSERSPVNPVGTPLPSDFFDCPIGEQGTRDS